MLQQNRQKYNVLNPNNNQNIVVVAQLTVWSLPIPEVCGFNPVVGKKIEHIYCFEKMKIKKKVARNGQFF